MDGFHFSTGICDRFARRLTLTAPRFQLRPQRFRVCDKAALPSSLKVRYDEDSKKPPSLPTSVIKQPGKQMAISLFTLSLISSPPSNGGFARALARVVAWRHPLQMDGRAYGKARRGESELLFGARRQPHRRRARSPA